MEWGLPILLLAALMISVGLSVWQTRRYTRDINAIALDHTGPGRHLVSGQGKGRTRGSIAALVIDSTTDEVVAASVMAGASVFARLKPAPDLCGPVAGVLDRTDDPLPKRALTDALSRHQNLRGPADTALSVTPPGAAPRREAATASPSGKTRIKVSRPPRTGVAPGPDNPRS